MRQSISLVTLGVADLDRATRFYADGFGWTPSFRNDQIAFYQMNGLVFGLFDRTAFAADMARADVGAPGGSALAHNVPDRADVGPTIDRLVAAGATPIRPASEPPHGGFRGYVADPDGHAWEIAWNPWWPIDADGHVTLAD